MHTRFRIAVLLFVTCLALAPRMASAQMTLTISNPIQTVAPGGTFTLMGTFTNTSSTDTLEITAGQINDVFFLFPQFTQLPHEDSSINSDYMVHNGVIVDYAPGATYTGPIMSFTVACIDHSAAAGSARSARSTLSFAW